MRLHYVPHDIPFFVALIEQHNVKGANISTLNMAAPQTVQMFWGPTTSVGSANYPPFRAIYNTTTQVRDLVMWTGTATTTAGGNFSVNLTVDGTATGTALFSNIYSCSALHLLNSTTPLNAHFAFLRGYTAGLKSAAFLAVTGANLTLGGNTIVAGATNQVFQITVIGTPA